MIKYCLKKWNKNKAALEDALIKDETLKDCDYAHLVGLVVKHILNDSDEQDYDDYEWDSEKITEIDNGDYQGTLLYLIPSTGYQPSEYDYLMTYVGYGSCCGCDVLQDIQYCHEDTLVPDCMKLCMDIVSNVIKPYNTGWRSRDGFEAIN